MQSDLMRMRKFKNFLCFNNFIYFDTSFNQLTLCNLAYLAHFRKFKSSNLTLEILLPSVNQKTAC